MGIRNTPQKKFPEYPSLSEVDKTQGPGELQVKAKEICEQVGHVFAHRDHVGGNAVAAAIVVDRRGGHI